MAAAIQKPTTPGVVIMDRCTGPRAMQVRQAVMERLSREHGLFRVSITPGLRTGTTEIVIDRLEGGLWCLVSSGQPDDELRRIDFRRTEVDQSAEV